MHDNVGLFLCLRLACLGLFSMSVVLIALYSCVYCFEIISVSLRRCVLSARTRVLCRLLDDTSVENSSISLCLMSDLKKQLRFNSHVHVFAATQFVQLQECITYQLQPGRWNTCDQARLLCELTIGFLAQRYLFWSNMLNCSTLPQRPLNSM